MSCVMSHDSRSLTPGAWYPRDRVFGALRCPDCGHRIAMAGVAPRQTRSYAPWWWPLEVAGRLRAISGRRFRGHHRDGARHRVGGSQS
jgi:DNA-directed RNA polymerase subunit RPC12/RpoP